MTPPGCPTTALPKPSICPHRADCLASGVLCSGLRPAERVPAKGRQVTGTSENAVTDLRRTVAELEQRLRERTAERDEALDQQIAITEVLQVISASPGDLAP